MYSDSYKAQAAGQTHANAYADPAPEVQNASSAILMRLNSLRSLTLENCSSACHAAEKVIGALPTPIRQEGTLGQAKDHPPAVCFLDALSQVISDLERTANETMEHVNRFHRSF